MAHQIDTAAGDTMFSVGVTPWHRLGTVLPADRVLTTQEAIPLAGADYEVELLDVLPVYKASEEFAANAATPDFARHSVADIKVIVRKDTKKVLGNCGNRWKPLQNKDAFSFFDPFVSNGLATLHTAGTLYGGKVVWVLAKINTPNAEIVAGDEVAKFVLLSNSHDGKTAVRVGFTPIRVVCANTLGMAHSSDASKLIRIRHSNTVKQNLDDVREIMNLANQEFEATADQYRKLANRKFNKTDIAEYVKRVLNIGDADEVSTRSKNIIEDIITKVYRGIGQDIPGVAGTWWAAYNGVTEYFCHKRGNTQENRVNSVWLGTGANDLKHALDLAVTMAG